jgi:ABC-2 type transport system permease protein
MLLDRGVDGVLLIPSDFARRSHSGDAEVQMLVNGTDANQARIMQGYAKGSFAQWSAGRAGSGARSPAGSVIVVDRMWFNDSNDSHFFIVPGLIVLVMTIIGAFLTAMVVAREWERGTSGVSLRDSHASRGVSHQQDHPLLWIGHDRFRALPPGRPISLPCAPPRIAFPALPRLNDLPSGVPGDRVARVHPGEKSVPRQPIGHDLDDDARDDALGFHLRPAQHANIHPGNHLCASGEIRRSAHANLYLAGNVGSVIWPNIAVLAAMAVALLVFTRLSTRKQLS